MFKKHKKCFQQISEKISVFCLFEKNMLQQRQIYIETEDIRTIFPSISVAIKLQKS